MLRTVRISLATVALFLWAGNVMAVEEAKYSVLRQEGGFELRKYDAHVLAETTVDVGFEDAGNAAFDRLFKYISGNNNQQQKVAMTSPVGQQRQDGKWVVSFMMPAGFTRETTPEPKDPDVSIREVPARHVAVVRYSGSWSENSYRVQLTKLQDWTAAYGLNALGEPIWARYNPPILPWFLRRNEILLPVASPASGP